MKLNELMIGDWVYNKHHKKNIQIKPYDFFVHWHGNNGTFAVSSTIASGKDLVPIPLTEEILVKNGFERLHHKGTGATEEYSEWFLGGIKITEWLEDWKDHHFSTGGDDCSISFNYVHQLQHLLRLCGIEKEIEL